MLRHDDCSVNRLSRKHVYAYAAAQDPLERVTCHALLAGGTNCLPRHFREDRLTFR